VSLPPRIPRIPREPIEKDLIDSHDDLSTAEVRNLLDAAVEGMDLGADDRRTLDWLKAMDQPTVVTVASLLRRARTERPATTSHSPSASPQPRRTNERTTCPFRKSRTEGGSLVRRRPSCRCACGQVGRPAALPNDARESLYGDHADYEPGGCALCGFERPPTRRSPLPWSRYDRRQVDGSWE